MAARDAWKLAMRAANSGRSKDLASLAIAQQAYEEVAAEREHWLAGGRMAIPIEPDPQRHDIEVAVGQELEWRKVLHPTKARGFLGRIKDRLAAAEARVAFNPTDSAGRPPPDSGLRASAARC